MFGRGLVDCYLFMHSLIQYTSDEYPLYVSHLVTVPVPGYIIQLLQAKSLFLRISQTSRIYLR